MEISVSKGSVKKIMAVFMALLIAMSSLWSGLGIFSFAVNREYSGFCGENVRFRHDGTTNTLFIYGEGPMWDYTDNSPFSCRGDIYNIVIGEGVTKIGQGSFMGCPALKSIYVPESAQGFEGAFDKDDISIFWAGTFPDEVKDEVMSMYPDGWVYITYSVNGHNKVAKFYWDHPYDGSFGSIEIQDDTTNDIVTGGNIVTDGNIGDNVTFSLNSDGVLYIEGTGPMYDYWLGVDTSVLCDNSDIKHVVIADGVTSVGDYVFNGCNELRSVNLPDSITKIGEGAFNACYLLDKINIPDNVAEIGIGALSSTDLARSYFVDEECDAFYLDNALLEVKQTELDSFIIREGTFIIAEYVFREDFYAKEITIPSSVRFICRGAFDNCKNLEKIYYDGTISEWNEIKIHEQNVLSTIVCTDGIIRTEEETDGNVTDGNITDGNIPLYEIEAGETKHIKIKSNQNTLLKFIPEVSGTYWFYSSSDEDTYGYLFDESMDNIIACNDDNPYGIDCNFSVEVSLQAGKTYYWGARFYDEGKSGSFDVRLECIGVYCEHLNAVEVEGKNPTCTEDGYTHGFKCLDCGDYFLGHEIIKACHVDSNADRICDVCGEDAVISSGNCGGYDDGDYSDNAEYILYSDGTLEIVGEGEIGFEAFNGNDDIKNVIIHEGITGIGESAFSYCENLISVIIPGSVTHIDYEAFYRCSSLVNLEIPDGVTKIGHSAFRDCKSLEYIIIPGSVTSLVDFNGCTSLVSITVDENNDYYSSDEYGVLFNKDKTEIINYPVGNERTSYTIPDSVTRISTAAFSSCSNLERVTIGNNVTDIEAEAFYGCDGLTSITIPLSVTTIYELAFGRCYILTDVYYAGTQEQWNEIHINDFANDFLMNAVIHFNSGSCYEGHTAAEAVKENEVAATCTADGSYDAVVYCSVCNAEISRESKVVTATGHTEVVDNAVAPTCTETGLTEGKHCSVCNEVLVSQETVASLGHAWDNGVINPEATCTEEGVKTYTCTVCEETRTEAVSAKGHTEAEAVKENEKAATCTEDGSYDTVVYCSVCKSELSREAIAVAATGHTEVTDKAVAPTCTETGLTEGNHCSACNEVLVAQETVASLGHAWSDWKEVVEPTLLNAGEKTRECSVCKENVTEIIAKLEGEVSTDVKTGISVEYTGDAYGESKMTVRVSEDDIAANHLVKLYDNYVAWNIKTFVDGVEIQPDVPVLVTLPIPSGFNKDSIAVYHIDSITGKSEKVEDIVVDGNKVKFLAESFSTYILVDESTELEEEKQSTFVMILNIFLKVLPKILDLVERILEVVK